MSISNLTLQYDIRGIPKWPQSTHPAHWDKNLILVQNFDFEENLLIHLFEFSRQNAQFFSW